MIYLSLFITFFKVGLFTFGGGYAMLPLIQTEVLAHGWMELNDLVNFIAVSESTPGPFAVNVSTYVGMTTGGFLGALCATLGVILPSFIIILIVARFFVAFKKNKAVKGVMKGLKPAVVGLISASILSVGTSVFFSNGFSMAVMQSREFIISCMIFIMMLVLSLKKTHPIYLILLSAVIGIISGYYIL